MTDRYDLLARYLVVIVRASTTQGATQAQQKDAVAQELKKHLYNPELVERLARVYPVDTDQGALIRLVHEAKLEVATKGGRQ